MGTERPAPIPILAGLRKIEDVFDVPAVRRRLRCMANSKHFYSESPQGMTLQVYIALIGTLLIALETGSRPSSYDFALMSMAAAGLAPLDQILAQAAKRRAERRRAAERQRARWAERNDR